MAFKISFTGDISLNGYYKQMALQNEDPFVDIAGAFRNSDVVVINLEAVCESPDNEQHIKGTTLSIDASTLKFLRTIKTGIACLANNHVYDNLSGGFEQTIEILKEHNIEFVGASLVGEQNEPLAIKAASKSIGLLNYVHESTRPGVGEKDRIELNIYDKKKIITDVAAQKTIHDFVILVLHWGQDNSRYPAPWQRKDAKSFADAGADIIIGHHSHVLQGFEKIGNSKVYYSLGNFAFSPIRMEDKIDQNRQTETIILSCEFSEEDIVYHEIPVRLLDHSPHEVSKSNIIRLSKRMPIVSNPFVWPFYIFYLNVIYKFYYFFFGNDRKPISQLRKINRTRIQRFWQNLFKFRN